MKTKIEIIDETVEYYQTHDRAVNSFVGCYYLTEDGRMCAHSRCLTDEAREKVKVFKNSSSAIDTIEELGDECHKEEYRGHSEFFWSDLQLLHDNDEHWDDRTLTIAGKAFVEKLKEKYKD